MKEELLSEILELTPTERLRLAQDIWASVYELPDTDELSPEQKSELLNRVKMLDEEPNRGTPWREVLSKLHSRK